MIGVCRSLHVDGGNGAPTVHANPPHLAGRHIPGSTLPHVLLLHVRADDSPTQRVLPAPGPESSTSVAAHGRPGRQLASGPGHHQLCGKYLPGLLVKAIYKYIT